MSGSSGGDFLSSLFSGGGTVGGGTGADPTGMDSGGTDPTMFDPTSYGGSYGSPVDVASAQSVQGTPFPSATGSDGSGSADTAGGSNSPLDLFGGNKNNDIMALVSQLGGARAQAGPSDVAPTGSSNTQGASWFEPTPFTPSPPQGPTPTFRSPIPPSATSPVAGQIPGRLAPPQQENFSPDIAPPVSQPMTAGPSNMPIQTSAVPSESPYISDPAQQTPTAATAPEPAAGQTGQTGQTGQVSGSGTPEDPYLDTRPPPGEPDRGPVANALRNAWRNFASGQGDSAYGGPPNTPHVHPAAPKGDRQPTVDNSWMTAPEQSPYMGGPPQAPETAEAEPTATTPSGTPTDTQEARIGQEVGANLPAATGGPGARSPQAPASPAAPEGGESYAGPSPRYAPDQSGGQGSYGQQGGYRGQGEGGMHGLGGLGGMQGLLPLIQMLMGGMGGRRGRGRFGGGFGRFGHGFGRFGREAGYGAHGWPGGYEGGMMGGGGQGQMNPAQLISDFLFGGPNALMGDLQGMSQQAGGGGPPGTGYGESQMPDRGNYGGGNYGGGNYGGYDGSAPPSGTPRRLPGPGTNQEAPAEPAPAGGAAPTSPQSPPASGNNSQIANAGGVDPASGGLITGPATQSEAVGGPSAYAEPGGGISGEVGSIMNRVMIPPGTKAAQNQPSGRPLQPNVDRSVFKDELAANRPSLPGARSLMEQAAWMVNGEVNLNAPVEAQRVQLETAFNRAQYKKMPLGVALRGTQMGGYYPPSTYSAGNRPNAAQLARFKQQVWDPVVNGSNVSDVGWGPMTGNASNDPRMGERGMVAQHQFRRGTLGYKMRGGDTYFRENVGPGQGLPVKGGAASNVPARPSWPEMTAAWPQ